MPATSKACKVSFSASSRWRISGPGELAENQCQLNRSMQHHLIGMIFSKGGVYEGGVYDRRKTR
jgi:hypothetical protein